MTNDPEAYRLYMIARHLARDRDNASLLKSIELYEAALARDRDFALAWAGLAESYIVLVSQRGVPNREGYEKARAAADRAVKLDPYSAEVQAMMGDIRAYYDWDFAGAERHFKKAIELNPNYITAHHWYATFLVAIGRPDEALREISIVQQLDPGSPRFLAARSTILFRARRFEEAEDAIKRAIDLDPKKTDWWDGLASIYFAQGRIEESVAAFQKSLSAEEAAKVGAAFKSGGYKAVRLFILRKLEARAAAGKYVGPAEWTLAYIRLGDKDRAFHWLEVMYQERSEALLRLRTTPGYDTLRADPRYWSLVRRTGLPEPVISDRPPGLSRAAK